MEKVLFLSEIVTCTFTSRSFAYIVQSLARSIFLGVRFSWDVMNVSPVHLTTASNRSSVRLKPWESAAAFNQLTKWAYLGE